MDCLNKPNNTANSLIWCLNFSDIPVTDFRDIYTLSTCIYFILLCSFDISKKWPSVQCKMLVTPLYFDSHDLTGILRNEI